SERPEASPPSRTYTPATGLTTRRASGDRETEPLEQDVGRLQQHLARLQIDGDLDARALADAQALGVRDEIVDAQPVFPLAQRRAYVEQLAELRRLHESHVQIDDGP